jgi:hypothetical protein
MHSYIYVCEIQDKYLKITAYKIVFYKNNIENHFEQLELEPLASHNVNSISSMFEDDFSQEVFYNIQLKKFF